jgi:acetyl-CoA carboxylase carboxyl transferase subunit alpha
LREEDKELEAWKKVQLARDPKRPYTIDYIRAITSEFVELHGDRRYGDDPAIVGGLAWLGERPVMVMGHQKGRDTKENVMRNFGMPRPEGLRKAARLMLQAEKFGFPVITFIDTPGASPDPQAEERGQAEAIAENLLTMSRLKVPIIAVIIGEGNSGGALAIAVADRILMQENAYFSVVSPEACAAILWRDADYAAQAAEALRLTSSDLTRLQVVDGIIEEPVGGAHENPNEAARLVGQAIVKELEALEAMSAEELVSCRYHKYRSIGELVEI